MDSKKVVERASTYKSLANGCVWISKVASMADAEQHPLIAILSNDSPWTAEYLRELDSDISALATVKHLNQVTASMKNKDEFLKKGATFQKRAGTKIKQSESRSYRRAVRSKRQDFWPEKK